MADAVARPAAIQTALNTARVLEFIVQLLSFSEFQLKLTPASLLRLSLNVKTFFVSSFPYFVLATPIQGILIYASECAAQSSKVNGTSFVNLINRPQCIYFQNEKT